MYQRQLLPRPAARARAGAVACGCRYRIQRRWPAPGRGSKADDVRRPFLAAAVLSDEGWLHAWPIAKTDAAVANGAQMP